MSEAKLTGSQTVGPFFSPCLLREGALRQLVAPASTPGEPVRLEGRIFDGNGEPIPDALVEIWQADASGRYNSTGGHGERGSGPAFTGYGRSDTSGDGYWFETVKPGAVPFGEGKLQAPHIAVSIFARGLLNHLVTRLYFEDEAANEADPILSLVPLERRSTLLAHRKEANGKLIYHLDFILQGEGETVFFNI